MYSFILGIDPGRKGALVLLGNKTGKVYGYAMMPTIQKEMSMDDLATILQNLLYLKKKGKSITKRKLLVVLEKPAPFYKKCSKSSVMTMGVLYGLLKGMLYGMGFSFVEIRPCTWTKKFYADINQDLTTKQKAKMVFENQFHQSIDSFPLDGKRPLSVQAEGLRDAYLIAQYGRLIYGRETN